MQCQCSSVVEAPKHPLRTVIEQEQIQLEFNFDLIHISKIQSITSKNNERVLYACIHIHIHIYRRANTYSAAG